MSIALRSPAALRLAALAGLVLVVGLLPVAPAIAGPTAGPAGAAEDRPSEDTGAGDERADEDDDVDVAGARIDGVDRVHTAARIAASTFEVHVETATALVAQAGDFPDALAAAGLAGLRRGPVLLTWQGRLPQATSDVLRQLGIDEVLLLGGPAAVSPQVQEHLERDYTVDRVHGQDRFATAAAAARRIHDEAGGVPAAEGAATVLLASGEGFADALTAGPLAYHGAHPILLTARDGLPPATARALDDLSVEHVIVLGGPEAVADRVLEDVEARGIAAERIFGGDRTATAVAFADVLLDRFGFTDERVLLGRGDDFPDALAAGPRGGAMQAPILLTVTPTLLGGPTASWLEGRCPGVEVVEALGGRSAVGADVLDDALDSAAACAEREPQRTITYTTGTRGEVHADLETFRKHVGEALTDERGWSLGGDIAYVETDGDGDVRMWLASPDEVAAAAAVCDRRWSCRVGDDIYINDERWRRSTETYRQAGRSLTEYRWYVVNHETGHWLGHDDYDHRCGSPDEPAPVMNQQSIRLNGCATNVWPLGWELDFVRERWLP